MSRVGKKPVPIPNKVNATVAGSTVKVKGPNGELSLSLPERLSARVEGKEIVVAREDDERGTRALHGLYRSLVANMVEGVDKGFRRDLEISGTGYKAEKDGDQLVLSLGFARPRRFPIPEGINIEIEKAVKIAVKGRDKHQVGLVAAQIRAVKPPDPYKAKGIKYAEEVVRRKAGKAGATAAGGAGGAAGA